MSIWIRAFCRRPLTDVTASGLREATRDADFLTWAEDVDLDEEAARATEAMLRFEGPAGELTTAQMIYRPGEPGIGIERWRGEAARAEVVEMLEMLEDVEGAETVRAVLDEVVETVGFELKVSDAESMGWAIAWHTAMWLAARGDGLVDAEGTWWDPVRETVVLESGDLP